MTSPELVIAGLIEAQRSLDLKHRWLLRPAEVVVAGATSIMIRFDGEGFEGTATVNVPATSLIGYVAVGARVMIAVVPPEGNYVVADLSGATSEYAFSALLDTTTSVAYVSSGASAALVGLTFVVPASGKTKITWGMEANNSGASFTLLSPQVATGSTVDAGTVLVAASDNETARVDNTNVVRTTNFVLFNAADYSVAPGSELNVALYHRVGAGTGLISRRRVSAVPVR